VDAILSCATPLPPTVSGSSSGNSPIITLAGGGGGDTRGGRELAQPSPIRAQSSSIALLSSRDPFRPSSTSSSMSNDATAGALPYSSSPTSSRPPGSTVLQLKKYSLSSPLSSTHSDSSSHSGRRRGLGRGLQ
jgi:hypothetical protein